MSKSNFLVSILFLSGILIFLHFHSYAQETFTISGTIQSAVTGETLIGVSVIAKTAAAADPANIPSDRTNNPANRTAQTAGTASNEYGFYSLSLPQGVYALEISALGMKSKIIDVRLNGDKRLDIPLEEATENLEAVMVTAPSEGRSLGNPQMGVEQLSAAEIKSIPVLLGERDIIKAMQLLPGIKSAGEGSSGFFVRGGAADQNLILLDEAPVYNASHLLGFFSTFNSDAIKNMTLYKGGMPAQYGGRLSSVLDLKMNEGNNRKYDVSGGIGLISAKLNVEGPLQQGRSSFLVTGRRTYADLFLKLSSDSTINNNTLYFYDLNAKFNYTLGEKDRVYLSGYFGQDRLGVGETFGLDWGNGTGTVRWNHIFSNKLFSNTSLIFSNYNYKIAIRSGTADFDIFSQIRDWNLKQEFQWFLNHKNNIRFGFNVIHHNIRPGEVTSSNGSINPEILQQRKSWENSLYASNTWEASDRLNITYGLRATGFSVLGEGDYFRVDAAGNVTDTLHYGKGEVVKTWLNLEPRLAASFRLTDNSSLKASYARNVQNLHLLSNSSASSPTDKWVASTNIIKPEIADQVSLGYYRNLSGDKYELTAETYYKDLRNQIDYRDGADVYWQGDAVETQLLFGKGRAYGIEWQLKKHSGRLTGWLSYTLSKTERLIEGINHGNWYNARQDRTHDIAIVAMYQLNPRWTLSANWVYYTGDAVTLPAGKYRVDGEIIYYYTERNAYRMPAYHRLDLGATWQLKQRQKFSSELTFSLYNAYGRENAYTISFRKGENDPNITEAVQTAIFKFIPSITYNFKF